MAFLSTLKKQLCRKSNKKFVRFGRNASHTGNFYHQTNDKVIGRGPLLKILLIAFFEKCPFDIMKIYFHAQEWSFKCVWFGCRWRSCEPFERLLERYLAAEINGMTILVCEQFYFAVVES